MTHTYADILRGWRKKRRYSQLSFGLHADVSARHLSFLESGRAKPSRDMVLKLADSLEMPRSEVNRALLSAGFAPAYKARPKDHADLAPIHGAIARLLENHMPYPALAMDRFWTITNANDAAIRFLQGAGFGGHTNLLEALAAQSPDQSSILNWEEAIDLLLTRLRAEMQAYDAPPDFLRLFSALEDCFKKHCKDPAVDRAQAIIPTRFKIGEQVLSLFSTIAQFGTVQDITLDELKVELMFPMDAETDRYFRR